MAECQRCGQCCTSASIILPNVKIGEDSRELAAWFTYHRCQPERASTDEGDVLVIRVPMICVYLIYDDETGLASCLNYDHRPQICRSYKCRRMQKD